MGVGIPETGRGSVSDWADGIERQLGTFQRRGPYLLLLLAVGLVLVTASAIDGEETVPVVLVAAAGLAGWHWWCVDRRWGEPLDDRLGTAYLLVRTVVAFALTWVNPFFVMFGFVGLVDAHAFVGRRGIIATLVVTATLMAGAQSGGLPPDGLAQGAVFVVLVGFNLVLYSFFDRLARKQDALSAAQTEAITELELTNARLNRALAENAELQRRLVQQARTAGVHEERERLALEIHDTIAQSLAGIVTQLAAADGATAEEAARRRDRAAVLARSALREARRSVQGLLPHRLDDHLLPDALGQVVDDWSRATGVAGETVVDGEPERLHRDVEATVLRVAQEALSNVDKHASARRVGVTLSYMGDVVTLDVRDDGRGFVVDGAPAADSVGLHGMRQRAARVAGRLVVESEPEAGTAVSLTVPVIARD